MINLIVETKHEYTTQLVNILTPSIFEGFNTIYQEALTSSNNANNILKIFQSFLKRIPKWEPAMIETETQRILNSSKSFSWLPELIKATIKTHIIVLSFNPLNRNENFGVEPKYYQNVNINEFIHKVYIECGREIWNNPHLFFHQYTPIEIKRNQREAMCIIKEGIKDAIRKFLPLKEVLELYLNDKLENQDKTNIDYEKQLTDVENKNIQTMIKQELSQNTNINLQQPNTPKPFNQNNTQTAQSLLNEIQNTITPQNPKMMGGNASITTATKNLDEKILDILKSDNISNTSSDTPLTKITKNITESHIKKSQNTQEGGLSIDEKIKKVLEKDLGESDVETSLSYNPEKDDSKYQEIFANTDDAKNHTQNNAQNGGNPSVKEKETIKNKRKFFSNYLTF